MKIEKQTIDGQTFDVKVPDNWYIALIHKDPGATKRLVCVKYGEDKSGQSTEITRVLAPFVFTRSGSAYKLDPANKRVGLWQMNIQIKEPEVYQRLLDLGVL